MHKIMESCYKSDVKKAKGLDGEIEKVFGERERLMGKIPDLVICSIGSRSVLNFGYYTRCFCKHF